MQQPSRTADDSSEPPFPAETCGGLEANRERTDHSSGLRRQERTVPNCHLPSTVVLSLIPECSQLQTGPSTRRGAQEAQQAPSC